MSRALLSVLTLALNLGLRPTWAQPTLAAENHQPYRYQSQVGGEQFSFALPGKRYLHCGSYDTPPTTTATQRAGLMLAVTKQNGDTVRYMAPPTHPGLFCSTFVRGASLNPDYTLAVCCSYLPNPGTATNRDSLLLLCLDTLGTIRWRHAYRPANGVNSAAGHLLRTGDGYLLATNRLAFPGTAGVYSLTPTVTKFDLQGRLAWEKSLGSRGYGGVGQAADLIACPDGSYLAFGNADNGAPYTPGSSARNRLDYFAAKFTSNGDTLRTFRFGDPATDEYGTRLRPTPDGGYAATGIRLRPLPAGVRPKDGQVLKLDSLFRPQWDHTLSWTGINQSTLDCAYSLLQPLATGHVLVGGLAYFARSTTVNVFGWAGQLTCYAPGGALAWDWQHRYQNWNLTSFASMVNHADGSALLTGGTASGTVLSNNPSYYTPYAYSGYLTGVGVPYAPDLCQHPPRATLATALSPDRATLQCLATAAAGPRYGQLTAWHWDFGDGTAFDGPAPPPHFYAPVPAPGTALTLTLTNNLGCTSTFADYPWGPLGTAQQLQGGRAAASLAPNPATDRATLTVPGWAGSQPVQVQVLDALGRTVLTTTARPVAGTLTATLDVGGLPAGVYAVRVFTPQGILTKRLIKE